MKRQKLSASTRTVAGLQPRPRARYKAECSARSFHTRFDSFKNSLFVDAVPVAVVKMSAPAATPAKPAKKPVAKPKKPAAHPKYTEMIAAALGSLKERGGSSRQAILKYIMAHYNVGKDDRVVNQHLKMALRAGAKNGSLKQAKGTGASGSFRLGEKAKAAPKKKVVAKKPKAAGAKKPKTPKKKAVKKAKSPKKTAKKPAAKKLAKSPAKPKKAKTPKKAKAVKKPKAAKPKKAAKKPAAKKA